MEVKFVWDGGYERSFRELEYMLCSDKVLGLGLVIVRDAIEKFGTKSFLFLDPWALGIGSLVERRGWPLLLLGSRTLL